MRSRLPTHLSALRSRSAAVVGLSLALLMLVLGWALPPEAQARRWVGQEPANTATYRNTPTIALKALPQHGQAVYALVLQGGPFQFDKDGSVFANREQILPKQKRGYYREYTVAANRFTPARGAKRIVCGGWTQRQPDDCYYSGDHYASFQRIHAQP